MTFKILLVTGGAGFIGRNFIEYWLQTHPQDYIINLDNLSYVALPLNIKNDHYYFVHGSINQIEDIEKCKNVWGCINIIVHFAAQTHVDNSIKDCQDFLETNIIGTKNLLEFAKTYNIHFHHISTDEVFGITNSIFNEDTPYNPRNPYSASKAAADHLVRAYANTFHIKTTITNCSNNYGPGQYPEKFIPLAITHILKGKKVPVYGNGQQIRDWIHVLDHCRAIDTILQTSVYNKTFCVGGAMSQEYTNYQVLEIICELLGKNINEVVEFVTDRPGHDIRYAVDSTKLQTELKFKFQYTDFKKGLSDTIDWYQENKKLWEKNEN